MTDLAPMIRLDVAKLSSFRKAALPTLAGLALMSWTGGMQLATIMLYLLGFLVAVNAFTSDDQYDLPLLYAGLPVSRDTVVTSHYLVGAGAFVASGLLAVPCAALSHLAGHGNFGSELITGLAVVLGTSGVAALALPNGGSLRLARPGVRKHRPDGPRLGRCRRRTPPPHRSRPRGRCACRGASSHCNRDDRSATRILGGFAGRRVPPLPGESLLAGDAIRARDFRHQRRPRRDRHRPPAATKVTSLAPPASGARPRASVRP